MGSWKIHLKKGAIAIVSIDNITRKDWGKGDQPNGGNIKYKSKISYINW